MGGKMLLRIEDTDQNRFVPGAEQYIFEALEWCGIKLDESPQNPGPHAPYRQSERKPMYMDYALKLVADGHAYYAFDTAHELDEMRNRLRTETNPNPQYDHTVRSRWPLPRTRAFATPPAAYIRRPRPVCRPARRPSPGQ